MFTLWIHENYYKLHILNHTLWETIFLAMGVTDIVVRLAWFYEWWWKETPYFFSAYTYKLITHTEDKHSIKYKQNNIHCTADLILKVFIETFSNQMYTKILLYSTGLKSQNYTGDKAWFKPKPNATQTSRSNIDVGWKGF